MTNVSDTIVGLGDDGKLDLGVVFIDQSGCLQAVICAKDVANIAIL